MTNADQLPATVLKRKAVVYDKVKLTQEYRNFDFLSPWEGMTSLPGDEKARNQ